MNNSDSGSSNTIQNTTSASVSGEDEVFDLTLFGIDDKAMIPTGLKVGQRAPYFVGVDQNGKTISSKTMLEKGPVVLQFYRASWCPVCVRYYSAITDSIPMISEAGASFIAVSPEMQTHQKELLRESGANFSILGDKDMSIMKNFDVLFKVHEDYDIKIEEDLDTNIAAHNGASESFLPIPATYVIDQKGKIVFVQFNYNYRKRASVKSILKGVKSAQTY
ncbi:MAG: AhpC/TSA family protein [Chitinophagales bacterium]|nr:AhpC/TSA family protein [Chitinophagales bacterium]